MSYLGAVIRSNGNYCIRYSRSLYGFPLKKIRSCKYAQVPEDGKMAYCNIIQMQINGIWKELTVIV